MLKKHRGTEFREVNGHSQRILCEGGASAEVWGRVNIGKQL